jgi:hypothetical protein
MDGGSLADKAGAGDENTVEFPDCNAKLERCNTSLE